MKQDLLMRHGDYLAGLNLKESVVAFAMHALILRKHRARSLCELTFNGLRFAECQERIP